MLIDAVSLTRRANSIEFAIVFLHLLHELCHAESEVGRYIIIYISYVVRGIVVCFKQKTIEATATQTLGVVVRAEAYETPRSQECVQLLRFAPETMHHPRHARTQGLAHGKQAVEGSDAVHNEGQTMRLAEHNLPAQHCLLLLERWTTQRIQPTLADGQFAAKVGFGQRLTGMPGVNAPGVASIDDGNNSLVGWNCMGVEVYHRRKDGL